MQRNLDDNTMLRNSVVINTQVPKKQQNEGFVRIKDAFFLFAGKWKWFVGSLIVAITCAYYYLQITPNIYRATASIMIKNDEKNGLSEEAIQQLGLKGNTVNITNELMSMKTVAVTSEVIKRLGLAIECYHSGAFHDVLAYGIDLPVKIELPDIGETDIAGFNLELRADSTVLVSDITINRQPVSGTYSFKLGKTVKTPLGVMSVKPSPTYVAGMRDDLKVVHRSMRETLSDYTQRIHAAQRDSKASIIDLSIEDLSRTRGEDILSTLVAVYNENWVRDRNQITTSTTDFIKDRLAIIEGELGNVETNISNYKSSNLMPDVATVGSMALNTMNVSQEQGREIDNRVAMTKYVRNYLTDGIHDKEQLPANSGIDNPGIEAQIAAYNSLLLQRNNHLAVSSSQNPLVMDIDQKLQTMKSSILASLDNELAMLNTQRQSVRSVQAQASGRVASNPQQAKYLLSFERQQKVKESLYLFLLQKREENELSQAFTAYNTRLIEHPRSDPHPVLPNHLMVIVTAVVLGLLIPAGILLLIENFNTAVRGRKDLESIHAPFVGEIPLAMVSKNGKKSRRVAREVTDNQLLVKPRSKNIMNEAFRVVRTNLEFILGFEGGHHVVMMTSMNPGSGKTFITANLSTALAVKGKKVMAIDLDMRRGSLSKYVDSPEMGVSNYLSGQVNDYHEVISKLGDLDVLPCGTIPPNPTELLFTQRFSSMIEKLKEEYDYIFIDCPPVEIVADAAIISRHAEMTLFVVRAHLMDRSFLTDIEKWYEERRFPNLSIILNGTRQEFTHYGYSRYGYHRYGYHYGHYGSYGYGDDSEEEAETPRKAQA